MRQALSALALVCYFLPALAQHETAKEEMLSTHSWEIKSHTMTGIGVHKSIPKGTIIEFLKDKTWRSSEPIEGFRNGKWSFENEGRTFLMILGETRREFLLRELTGDKLSCQLRSFGAVYTFEWLKHQ